MLANTYKETNTSKITVTKPGSAKYCTLEATSFLEPKGMHIFSIHNLPLYKTVTPIFKTNPLTAYLAGTAIDKATTKISTNTGILAEAHKRLSFIPGDHLVNHSTSIDLTDLQAKMYKTFANTSEAGIIAFRPKINASHYYGFRLTEDNVKLAGNEKVVVKLVAKIPHGLSLKFICACSRACSDPLANGFILKDGTLSTEATGTNK